MLLDDCPVCRIVNGEIEVNRLYEDDHVLAFCYISPVNPGHMLVVPKEHLSSVAGVDEAGQAAMMHVGAELGKHLMRVLDVDGFNLHLAVGDCAGQGLEHTHLHVIPRSGTDGFHWNWRTVECSNEEMNEICDSVRQRMEEAK